MPIYKGSFSVFPVYAGVILKGGCIWKIAKSVPRVCGGDPISLATAKSVWAVFPVYAGVILEKQVIEEIEKRVPRVCGGDPDWNANPLQQGACSPCMRG